MTRLQRHPRNALLIAAAALMMLATTRHADAADLNQKNRLDDGKLGMPMDSMFKPKPQPSLYGSNPGANSGSTPGDAPNFMPPLIDTSPRPPSRPKEQEAEGPLGSALGGRRR